MTENVAVAVLNPSLEELLDKIIKACGEAKGKDTVLLDVSKISDIAQYFVIVSGRSDRQVQGISNKIIQSITEMGIAPTSVEGLEEGQWVLMDTGDVVVHVFYEPTREYYDLEGLWASAKRLEVGSKNGGREAA
ncbi:MAG: ribosome silencing factor [Deltaproteobacteria bacterium]|nr:ribosome silencing factor [Deltaproteobacteria bacterium]